MPFAQKSVKTAQIDGGSKQRQMPAVSRYRRVKSRYTAPHSASCTGTTKNSEAETKQAAQEAKNKIFHKVNRWAAPGVSYNSIIIHRINGTTMPPPTDLPVQQLTTIHHSIPVPVIFSAATRNSNWNSSNDIKVRVRSFRKNIVRMAPPIHQNAGISSRGSSVR